MFGNDMLQFSGKICSWNALMVHLTMSHVGCRRRSHWTSSLPIHGTLDLKLKDGETRKALKHNKGRVSENLTWPYMAHIPNSWKLKFNLHYEFRMFWIDCSKSKWINPQLVCCFVAVIEVVVAALPGLCFSPWFFLMIWCQCLEQSILFTQLLEGTGWNRIMFHWTIWHML